MEYMNLQLDREKAYQGGTVSPRYVTKINVQNKNVTIGERNDLLVSSFIVEELSCVNDLEYKKSYNTNKV